ncbi:MAG: pyridoxamine 5'-phosphate oxidase family protein [bacterium]
MRKEVLDYIETQRVGVLAVEMMDGSPHASTVHVAKNSNASVFYIETFRSYRKAEALFGRRTSRASMVIGFDELDMKTLQIDGEVRLLETELEKIEFEKYYFTKFPNKKTSTPNPDFVPFVFIPLWWRYTDWTDPSGKIVYNTVS